MTDDSAVNELLEEAEDDLRDAEYLARRPGSLSASLYQASQAAEKFLRAWSLTRGRSIPLHWDLGKIFEASGDLAGLAPLTDAVQRLAAHATPGRSGAALTMVTEGIRTARTIRYLVRTSMGEDVPPPTEVETVPVENPPPEAPVEARNGSESVPGAPPATDRRRPPKEPGSYVKQVWLCERCGVRLPRTRQTGRGASCPHCNRPMRLVPGH